MNKLITIGIVTTALILGSGCANAPALIRAMAKDPNAATLSVKSIYVDIKYSRSGVSTNSVIVRDGDISINPK